MRWLTLHWVTSPRFEIAASLAVIMCGQVLWWRRRDNVFGYIAGATYIVTIAVPIFGTNIIAESDPQVARRLAGILMIGAVAHVLGLGGGGVIGNRARLGHHHTFTQPFGAQPFGVSVPPALYRWARRLAIASVVLMVGSFALLGYIPAFAADKAAAKYGVGIYAAGAARGGLFYHIALALGSVALPIMLVIFWRRRRFTDLALSGAIGVGLLLTLSRQNAFSGPLIVLVAVLAERRWKPWRILGIVCLSLFFGTLVNELIFSAPEGVATPSFASRVAASAPDVHDQLGFLSGFQILGSERIGTRTLTAGLSVHKGRWDPGQYAVRTLTLLPDASGVGSGGIRLPAAEWGYASYGWPGVVVWSLLSGLFAGWGTVVVRRLVAPANRGSRASLNYVLAWVFYTGTFGLLADFYFPERSGLLLLMVALAVGYAGIRGRKRAERESVNAAFWQIGEIAAGRDGAVSGASHGAPIGTGPGFLDRRPTN